MKIKLKTEGEFDAAHHLENYDGKCSRVHGHRWKVVVWIEGNNKDLDKAGILWDFTNLKEIINIFDHYDLNNILGFNPTAENISIHILNLLKTSQHKHLKFKVRVYESPKSYSEVEDESM